MNPRVSKKVERLKCALLESLGVLHRLEGYSATLSAHNELFVRDLPERKEQIEIQRRIGLLTTSVEKLKRRRLLPKETEKLRRRRRKLKKLKKRNKKLSSLILKAVHHTDFGRESAEVDELCVVIERDVRRIKRRLHGLNIRYDEDALTD